MISTASAQDTTRAYPNPVTDIVNVELPKNGSYHLKIVTTTGEFDWSNRIYRDKSSVDISRLKPGIYLMVFYADNMRRTYKIVKL